MKPRRIFPLAALILGASVSAQAATIQISMENLEIAPAQASAKVGDTIEWVNKDVLAHTATARNGDFDVMLTPKKSATFVLKKGRHHRVLLPLPSQHEGSGTSRHSRCLLLARTLWRSTLRCAK
jgi:plastocyanin